MDHDLGLLLKEYLAAECVSDHGKAACANLGGECVTERDGYYIVSSLSVLVGALLLVFYIRGVAHRLQGLFSSFCLVMETVDLVASSSHNQVEGSYRVVISTF